MGECKKTQPEKHWVEIRKEKKGHDRSQSGRLREKKVINQTTDVKSAWGVSTGNQNLGKAACGEKSL